MMKKINNILILLGTIIACIFVVYVLYKLFNTTEIVLAVFVLGAFIVSSKTDGYIYGIIFSLLSVAAVNFAFTRPYYAFDFTVLENIISASALLVISVLISSFTIRLKKHKEKEAQVERESLRANLLRAISHDLRTPLTTIYGSSSAILENYEEFSDDNIKKMLSGIKEDSLWLNRMVENLLSITKIENGNLELNKDETVLDELIDSILVKFLKRYPDTVVNLDLPEEFVTIPMDPILIEQVAINILENSVIHGEGMTKIDFKVSINGKKAIFEITDDGCGIPLKKMKTLFTGSYVSDSLPDRNKNNAGIGLSVCDSIIKAHGGGIEAENKKEGGAVFRFWLNEVQYDE